VAHDFFHFAFQATSFLLDPSGNALELKAYRDPSAVDHR
jgi:extradiol dioxygenase family protein